MSFNAEAPSRREIWSTTGHDGSSENALCVFASLRLSRFIFVFIAFHFDGLEGSEPELRLGAGRQPGEDSAIDWGYAELPLPEESAICGSDAFGRRLEPMVLATLLVTLGVVSASWASPAVTQGAQGTPTEFFAGIVLAVNPSNGLLSVEEASLDAEHETFAIVADTDIRKGGAVIGLGSIRVGDPVSVEYTKEGNRLVARKVKVITKPETR